jgi:hypothetical protein
MNIDHTSHGHLTDVLSEYLGLTDWFDAKEMLSTHAELWTADSLAAYRELTRPVGGYDREAQIRLLILRYTTRHDWDLPQPRLFDPDTVWPRWLCHTVADRLIEVAARNYIPFLSRGDERAPRCLHLLAKSLELRTAHGLPTHPVRVQMSSFNCYLDTNPDDVFEDHW